MRDYQYFILKQRLDTLALTGCCVFVRDELYQWFGLQRLAKAPWRVINQAWQEMFADRNEAVPDLTVWETDCLVVLRREKSEREKESQLEQLV